MTGAYSDNQPDYCWINPHETKEFTAYWYGIRNLQHVNRGNELATLNMDIDQSGKIHVAANVTQIRKNAKVEVRKADGTLLYSKVAYIAPDKPFADDFTTDAANVAEPSEVTMTVYSAEGQELLSYHPYKLDRSKPLPESVVPLDPDPKSIDNIEDLYYLGMRNLQFHQAHVDPNIYFEEAVRRDPLDVRSNTQLGIYYRKAGDYEKAKSHLRKSLVRQTSSYTRPADGESMYNLGLILKDEGKYADAVDTLYRAAWDYEYASAAYYQLAQISVVRGNAAQAVHEAEMAVAYNGMNIDAKNLLTTLSRKAGESERAAILSGEVLEIDPLNYYASAEQLALGAIPDGEREHAAQLVKHVLAPCKVRDKQNLSVGVLFERPAFSLELSAKVAVVVNLAVEDDDVVALRIHLGRRAAGVALSIARRGCDLSVMLAGGANHRLASAFKVDKGQTAMT